MDSQHVNYKPISPAAMVNLVLVGILVIVAISLISTCYYTVDTDEKGVVYSLVNSTELQTQGLDSSGRWGLRPSLKLELPILRPKSLGFVHCLPVSRLVIQLINLDSLKSR